MQDTLLVKMFVGKFNDENISHEVINLYSHDNNNGDYYYLYIPPHGTIGKNKVDEENPFTNTKKYMDVKDIVFFKKINVNHTYQLISYAKDVECFKNLDEIRAVFNNLRYNHKPLSEINFGLEDDEDLEQYGNVEISNITYKVKKENYYDLREKNIYIYPANPEKSKHDCIVNLEDNKRNFLEHYPNYMLHELDFLSEWHTYTSIDKDIFNRFLNENVSISDEDRFNLPELRDISTNRPYNNDNTIKFIDKLNDENIITNMIFSVLKVNPDLKLKFVNWILNRINHSYNINDDNNILVKKQHKAMWDKLKLCSRYALAKNEDNKRKYAKEIEEKYNMTPEQAKDYARDTYNTDQSKYRVLNPGNIDLFLEGNDFRIVIENKVKSGLNGLFEDANGNVRNQLHKYNRFLSELNNNCEKNNIIILFAPDYNRSFNVDLNNCYIIKYSELYDFFNRIKEEHGDIISNTKSEYYDLMLNSIAKHSNELYDEIQQRFYLATI